MIWWHDNPGTGGGNVMVDTKREAAAREATYEVVNANAGHGGRVTALASAVAILFSGFSLWETSLKQPQLTMFVAPVVHYTRDPNGDYEVFAIPITVANQGARDGAILSFEMDAKQDGADTSKTFYSAYTVDGRFFVKPGSYNIQTRQFDRVDRPKTPFAPVAVPGRGTYTGTILFYAKGKVLPKIVSDKGKFELTIRVDAQLDESLGFLDRLWRKATPPVTFKVALPYFSKGHLLIGGTHRMKNIAWSPPDDGADKQKATRQ
jgi:hypothetical protein